MIFSSQAALTSVECSLTCMTFGLFSYSTTEMERVEFEHMPTG